MSVIRVKIEQYLLIKLPLAIRRDPCRLPTIRRDPCGLPPPKIGILKWKK